MSWTEFGQILALLLIASFLAGIVAGYAVEHYVDYKKKKEMAG